MELIFLGVLLLLMLAALTAGYPVAFALPGASILAIALAAVCGMIFAGNPDAYFAQDGPTQWLSAGVTNFRSLYWNVERDTLIAIPLFIFMGIMLQKSKIAEDVLVAMAQLFGPVPGGLGISVVFVGALLAATTGIVGATVIAMGLISLPAMLRNKYSPTLAGGTICAAGTLGQIIPPSIVLIILADQLSSAADQASAIRKADYREATGEYAMPSELDITSASAGDMFMGALLPGILLVGLYMAYILVTAYFRPHTAPPVAYDGKYDAQFVRRIFLALAPPLALIFAVLGSIITGIATVNQAGAIGAVGAILMGGYRLHAGKRRAYWPVLMALGASAILLLLTALFDLNIKNIRDRQDVIGLSLAAVAVAVLLTAVLWSAYRAYRHQDTLREVMTETAKTTSMVFIILIGAAMLTSAFRGFGGEHLVKEFLTGLPGGFWTQFVVVMAVIFILGFFLDFIEIAVVVVPIVAPILLADPSANITAVWLGVMIGLNIQTSFLTPPFGFALFYLRGVAPPAVKTTHIYKGAAAFIILQLAGLAIAGYFPNLVNYMPNRAYLTSDTAPPPINPRLQYCLERRVFAEYISDRVRIDTAIATVRDLDLSILPASYADELNHSINNAPRVFELAARVTEAEIARDDYAKIYAPTHRQTRRLQREIANMERRIAAAETRLARAYSSARAADIHKLQQRKQELIAQLPADFPAMKASYRELANTVAAARRDYQNHADAAYRAVADARAWLREHNQASAARELSSALDAYHLAIKDTIGLRLQPRLTRAQAKDIAACQSRHRDISLHF